jgi:type III pantothenate kinase
MLLIDVGNTRLKWMLTNSDGQAAGEFAYTSAGFDDQLETALHNVLSCPVWISCVVEPVKKKLETWFETRWAIAPQFVSGRKEFAGVTNAYLQPEKLGVDRWLAMVAAYDKYHSALCVIDCGTAATFDVIDTAGVHQGGLIMPGLHLLRTSLVGGADKLRDVVSQETIAPELANNTNHAVVAGCDLLLATGLDGLSAKQRAIYGDKMKTIITGGDGARMMRLMSQPCIFEPDLVLMGLRKVATQGM